MFLSQIRTGSTRAVVAREGNDAWIVPGVASVIALAEAAITAGHSLEAELTIRPRGPGVDLHAHLAAGEVLTPVDHPDPAHLHITGAGLTHPELGNMRNALHIRSHELAEGGLTDSQKIFRMGKEAGHPAPGRIGALPEWFWKGNGHTAVSPEAPLVAPGSGLDASEEPEIVGIYLIGPDGQPWRLGFALGNEMSDHVIGSGNYLWRAHSKLRPASFGPELRLGPLPREVSGHSRILRGGKVIWQRPFTSGEAAMSHSIANLEHHHFKYGIFRQPGDIHVHYLGTSTLSVADGIATEPGDRFEIEAEALGLPLRNPLELEPAQTAATTVRML